MLRSARRSGLTLADVPPSDLRWTALLRRRARAGSRLFGRIPAAAGRARPGDPDEARCGCGTRGRCAVRSRATRASAGACCGRGTRRRSLNRFIPDAGGRAILTYCRQMAHDDVRPGRCVGLTEPSGLIGSAQRALRVLDIVGSAGDGITAKAVARRAGYNLSTTYHLLNTLVHEGYLIRLGHGRGFGLGYKVGQPVPAPVRGAGRRPGTTGRAAPPTPPRRGGRVLHGLPRDGHRRGGGGRLPGVPARDPTGLRLPRGRARDGLRQGPAGVAAYAASAASTWRARACPG